MAKAFCAARIGWTLVTALWLVLLALSGPAQAQADYPSRTIRVVTPFAAGAASDIALRILAEKMSGLLKVPVVVQNQPGGGGVIAGRSVTNAPADGYTIGWVGNNTAIGVSLFREPFDPRADMRPIVGVSEFAYLFVTGATSPYKTLAEWMAAAKQKPDTLSAGTSSAGTSNHLTALLFKSAQHLDFTVVPYRGPAELSVALLRNDVDLVVNAYGGLRAAIDAKQIRPLAATSAARLPELPDVPTMKEAGVDNFVVSSWNGLYGSKDMPQQAVDVLARAATEALAQPDVKAQFKEIGFDARALPADAQDKLMRTEIDRWAKVIADAGISKQ
jgi:tripartite-type tricarboxylate transporter receptor subunit TctC